MSDTHDIGQAETVIAPPAKGHAPAAEGVGATVRIHDAREAAAAGAPTELAAGAPGRSSLGRSTVLPRVALEPGEAEVHVEQQDRPRYQCVRQLGAGGMGEVDLARDNDIDRLVALKRLLPEAADGAGLGRFVDEIRTIGRLEHPNIVPIHDVGLDEQGRYFFVMKYVEGQTIESIISKLAAGDREAHASYGMERRLDIFLGLLHALSLAHDRGIVHRDIKPANVMVGRYGEVVLMDWGIAKTVGRPEAAPRSGVPSVRAGRLSTTQLGTLIGTPAYMSPEQAAGDNDRVDRRSDLYSACVLLYELVTLRHYLGTHQTVDTMLEAIVREDYPAGRLADMADHPAQRAVPWELIHFVTKGLRKQPEERYQSAAEMVAEMERIAEGRIRVLCSATLAKRMAREFGRLVDRHPLAGFVGFVAATLLVGFGVWGVIALLMRVI